MKPLIFLIFAAALAGCSENTTESVEHAGVGGFEVARLFTHEGCTVYRFYDGGSRYFANCNGSATTSWRRAMPCGKNCTRVEHQQVPTAQGDEQP